MDECPYCEVPLVEGRLACQGATVGWFMHCPICSFVEGEDAEIAEESKEAEE